MASTPAKRPPKPAAKAKAKPKPAAKATVAKPLLHEGKVLEPGAAVPEDLSVEALKRLQRLGIVA